MCARSDALPIYQLNVSRKGIVTNTTKSGQGDGVSRGIPEGFRKHPTPFLPVSRQIILKNKVFHNILIVEIPYKYWTTHATPSVRSTDTRYLFIYCELRMVLSPHAARVGMGLPNPMLSPELVWGQ